METDAKEMVKLYKKDPSIKTSTLAERYGCSIQTIRNTLRRAGVYQARPTLQNVAKRKGLPAPESTDSSDDSESLSDTEYQPKRQRQNVQDYKVEQANSIPKSNLQSSEKTIKFHEHVQRACSPRGRYLPSLVSASPPRSPFPRHQLITRWKRAQNAGSLESQCCVHTVLTCRNQGREMIEVSIAPKPQKLSAADHAQLTDLLLSKDSELKKTLELADEQAKIQQKMNELKAEVENKDQDIFHLQRQLKDAEQILATSLYQARQKLASIVKSRKKPVSSEDLIKFAHRISASNAVSAPLTWQPGDPRRPYPTDLEMRLGMLGRLCDLPLNGHTPSTLNELHRMTTGGVPATPTNQFTWHPSGELHMSVGGGNSVAIDGRGKDAPTQEDVEVMSTDSSSSSSSDSQ